MSIDDFGLVDQDRRDQTNLTNMCQQGENIPERLTTERMTGCDGADVAHTVFTADQHEASLQCRCHGYLLFVYSRDI